MHVTSQSFKPSTSSTRFDLHVFSAHSVPPASCPCIRDWSVRRAKRVIGASLLVVFIFQILVTLSHLEPRYGLPFAGNISLPSFPVPPVHLERCQEYPHTLLGHVHVRSRENRSFVELASVLNSVHLGGSWQPSNCTARWSIAVIVPYRDREKHFRTFLSHMHPFLQRQQLAYTIYLVEQDHESKFNRGMLLNIGFTLAEKLGVHDCYFFHDVDLLPENDNNLYSCPDQPRHVSVAVDKLRYKLPYQNLFGGIEAFTKEHFRLVNGFSNVYFGWGAEDDDLYNRLQHHGLNMTRYATDVARYKMLRHMRNDGSQIRLKYLKNGHERYDVDGLNSLIYDVKTLEKEPLYTHILVHLDEVTVLVNAARKTMPKTEQMRDKSTLKPENDMDYSTMNLSQDRSIIQSEEDLNHLHFTKNHQDESDNVVWVDAPLLML